MVILEKPKQKALSPNILGKSLGSKGYNQCLIKQLSGSLACAKAEIAPAAAATDLQVWF